MKVSDFIEILIPAACARAAGVVIAHERLVRAASHTLPKKICAAAMQHIRQTGNDATIHLSDGIRLEDGEILFTLHCQVSDPARPICLAKLRAAVYAKLGITKSRARSGRSSIEMSELGGSNPSNNADVELRGKSQPGSSTLPDSPSMSPNPARPTETAEFRQGHRGEVLESSPALECLLVREAGSIVHDESVSDKVILPTLDPAIPSSFETSRGEANAPTRAVLSSDDLASGEDATVGRHESVQNEAASHLAGSEEMARQGVLANEPGMECRDLTGKSKSISTAPELILENEVFDEVSEMVEDCSDVLLLTVLGTSTTWVLVPDNGFAVADVMGMDLVEQLACKPHRKGGLWELREFRVEESS